MNGINNKKMTKPVLTIAIPIYNRLTFLERMLSRFYEEKELFNEKIELLISDNCSIEDLLTCVNKYRSKGLIINYNRNNVNIGADGNFLYSFKHAKGKYCWLLGSDDIPLSGFVKTLISFLENEEYGLFHINIHDKKNEGLKIYNDNNACIKDINYWITFISSNIINSELIQDFDLNKYKGTFLIQVPIYLHTCLNYKKNAILKYKCFEDGCDSSNNGGYNFFSIFVENLFAILEEFSRNGLLQKKTYRYIKRIEYKRFLVSNINSILIFKKNKNFDKSNSFKILSKYYSRNFYAYYYLFIGVLKDLLKIIFKKHIVVKLLK